MIQAENLTISIPGTDCNKNCPYCISKMTPTIKYNENLWYLNFDKVKTVAKASGVYSVLFTGKGEPTLNLFDLKDALNHFKEFPTELQTNGRIFNENPSLIKEFSKYKLNTIAISIDLINHGLSAQLEKLKFALKVANDYGINIRLSINVTDHFRNYYTNGFNGCLYIDNPFYILTLCKDYKIDQLLFRKITKPFNNNWIDNYFNEYNELVIKNNWIDKYTSSNVYKEIYDNFMKLNHSCVRMTTNGVSIWDFEGISVVFSDYCIQEMSKSNNIRSLIYQADGHLYTSWNSKASKLF